jgi:AcrR family transcriptional regulator
VSSALPRSGAPTRDERERLILDTADRLFYARGIRAVGMDELVRETGLGKMSLYRIFPTKDELVGASLRRRAATLLRAIDAEIARHRDDPRAALVAIFDGVDRETRSAGFRGCPLANAGVEFDDPAHPTRVAAVAYKQEVLERLTGLAQRLRPAGDAELAGQLALVIEGTYASAGITGPRGPAARGHALAVRLIDRA